MTKKDKTFIYHQRILGRMVVRGFVSDELIKDLRKIGSLIVAQIANTEKLQTLQRSISTVGDKNYIYGIFGFRLYTVED